MSLAIYISDERLEYVQPNYGANKFITQIPWISFKMGLQPKQEEFISSVNYGVRDCHIGEVTCTCNNINSNITVLHQISNKFASENSIPNDIPLL